MDFDIITHAGGLRVALKGRLTFTENEAFRRMLAALSAAPGAAARIAFDLAEVSFIDSAGLGLLLHARDCWRGRDGRVTLAGADGQVARMLTLARFDALFDRAA
ncbi:MAG: hypothetical protein RLZZ501_2593 [Pseudomonadota bacterium]|jgi:anti-anti-sigma factor